MAIDKPISGLPSATAASGSDLLALAQGANTNKLQLSELITFIGNNLATGATIFFGTILPQNTVGKNGDIFFFTDSGKIAQKSSNVWSIVYTPTSGGADGSIIYGNDSPPADTIGVNGDTYINVLTGVFYKKAAGTWAQKYSVQTSATVTTLPILFGATSPASSLGVDSQSYINTNTRDFYVKEAGSWVLKFTIPSGANGKTILNGTTNPSNATGTDGDFYVNTSSNTFYGPKTVGVWGSGFPMVGSDGVIPVPLTYNEADINSDGFLVIRTADLPSISSKHLLTAYVGDQPVTEAFYYPTDQNISGFGNWIGQTGLTIKITFI